MKFTVKMLVAAVAMGGFFSLEASASTITYVLDQSNIETVMPDNVPYVTVTITDGLTFGTDTNAVKFTVDVINSAFIAGTKFGIQDFGFNLAAGAPPVADSNIFIGSTFGSPNANWVGNIAPTQNQLDGYGRFNGDVKRTVASAARFDPLEFWITGVTGDTIASYAAPSTNGNLTPQQVPQGNAWFVALVGGFTTSDVNITSGYFGGGNGAALAPQTIASVPVPAAVWLFGSALMGFLGMKKRKTAAI